MALNDEKNFMKLWCLGTGNPDASLKRASSGYLVQINDDYIVFDHGFGAHQRLLELGVPATKITHVFLSHYHFDHLGDFPRLFLTRWDHARGQIPELKIFGPPPLLNIMDKLFASDGVYGPDLAARTKSLSSRNLYALRGGIGERPLPQPEVTELNHGDVIQEHDWTVRVVEVTHCQPYLIPLAFRLEHGGQSLVYSGDSTVNDELERLADSCDLMIYMCAYLSSPQNNQAYADSSMGHLELAEMAQRAKVKNLVLTHLQKLFDNPGVKERAIAEIKQIYQGNLYVGEDLMEISFNNLS